MKRSVTLLLIAVVLLMPLTTRAVSIGDQMSDAIGGSSGDNSAASAAPGAGGTGIESALGSVTSQCQSGGLSGSLGGIIGQLLGGLTGQALSGTPFAGIASSLVKNLTGNLTNQALQSLFGSSNLSGILGLGSGSLGSIPGLGSILGGGTIAVPISNESIDITHVPQIRKDQDTYIAKVCVGDVAVKIAANQSAVNFSTTVIQDLNTGNAGTTRWSQNRTQENVILGATVFDDFVRNQLPKSGIEPSLLQEVQRQLVTSRQLGTDLKGQLTCPIKNPTRCLTDISTCPGATLTEKMGAQTAILSLYPQCTVRGAFYIAATAASKIEASRIEDRDQLIEVGNGIIPPITCTNPSGNVPDYKCITYKVLTPAAVTTKIAEEAAYLGTDKQAHADEITELVDALFAQLAQQILTSLTGLIGVSQSQSGNPSYLDQVSSGSNATTVSQTKSLLQGQIENSMGIEVSYQAALTGMIQNLENTKAAFAAVQACYAKLTVGSVNGSTPQELANAASTTIATVIQPQIDQLNILLENSQNALSQLTALDTQVQAAQTIDELNTLSNAYDALAASGALHTSTDLQAIQDDAASSAAVLESMTASANTSLAQCQAAQ